jgi:hypothetical protein
MQTANGLNLIYLAVFWLLGSVFGLGAVAMILKAQALLFLMGLVIIGAAIAGLIGHIKLSSTPEISGARNLGVGIAVCTVVSAVLDILDGFSPNPPLQIVNALCGLYVLFGFPVFVQRIATYLGDDDLCRSASSYLWFIVACLLGGIVSFVMFVDASNPEGFPWVLGLLALLAGLTWFIWYMRLIRNLRDAIRMRYSV